MKKYILLLFALLPSLTMASDWSGMYVGTIPNTCSPYVVAVGWADHFSNIALTSPAGATTKIRFDGKKKSISLKEPAPGLDGLTLRARKTGRTYEVQGTYTSKSCKAQKKGSFTLERKFSF